ncbi:MAG TPA: hypothetical protein VK897_08500 [Anaerolineales bacterium]|nr:hypothetical protein [Anaerolineales bacterium]
MNKLLLITVAVLLLATVTACAPRLAINGNPEEVSSTASKIADFDLPADYAPEFSASLAGYDVAAYSPGDGHSHLYLIQSENETDSAKLEEMLAEMVPGSSDANTRMTVIENRSASLRGESATIVTSDGVDHEGGSYRQITVAFQGKGGPALLVLSEPTERWDQSTVDVLLASIQ